MINYLMEFNKNTVNKYRIWIFIGFFMLNNTFFLYLLIVLKIEIDPNKSLYVLGLVSESLF